MLFSTFCWAVMATLLAVASMVFGPIVILKLYFLPLWVFIVWLDLVTYLHHHGHQQKLPWYRGKVGSSHKSLVFLVD